MERIVRKHHDFANFRLTEDQVQPYRVLDSLYAYEEGMVKIILGELGSIAAFSASDVASHSHCPIKIEHYEKFSPELYRCCEVLKEYFRHRGPVTAHLFLSPAGSISFPMHTDPDDVLALVVKGTKKFKTEQGDFEVGSGEALFIPSGTPHMAVNDQTSIMLSFGLEKFIVDKL